MSDSNTAPVVAGFAVGIAFIILLYAALNPPFSRFLTDVSPQEQVLIDKAGQQEAAQLFLKQYPFAKEGVLNRDPIVEYDENGDIASQKPAVTVAYYTTWPITIITYEGVKLNNQLVKYEQPSLWITMDLDGEINLTQLRCGISYLESHGAFGTAVAGDDVLRFLRAGKLPC